MGKKSKIKTPDWILKGEEPKKKKNKGKTFKLKECPKCNSDDVKVVVGKERKGDWQCNNCKWEGQEIKERELNEEEFMKYLDEKGEEVS